MNYSKYKYGKVAEVLSFILGCSVHVEHSAGYRVTLIADDAEQLRQLLSRLNELVNIPRLK